MTRQIPRRVDGRATRAAWARRRPRGFSLLEILVAFAIAALSLGMLYRVTGNSARQTSAVVTQERAMLLAESLLATRQSVPEAGVDESGEGAGFAWHLASRPYPTPTSDASPQVVKLHEVTVNVRWLDGTLEREFALTTLRPERRPPPGGRL